MRKNLVFIFIALSALSGLIATSTFTAEANNGQSIDRDPTLPTCTYNLAVSNPGAACNRPVRVVDNLPDALEDSSFFDEYEVFGINYYVECSHFGDLETQCVLIDQLFDIQPTPVPTPTPAPEIECGVGLVKVLNNNVAVCVPPNPVATSVCPDGLVDGGISNGIQVCNRPATNAAAIPSFTGADHVKLESVLKHW